MEAHRISQYRFSKTDKLLFDANIWLFIYSPQYRPSDQRTAVYSAALKKILDAGSHIFIDAVVLSEFVNVLVRFAYNALPLQTKSDFKTFRKSQAFKPIPQSIADACRRILMQCTRTESGFVSLNIGAVLSKYETGKTDFNDQVLTELCKSKAFKFVTDDGDFKGQGLTILTANKRLLT